MSRPLTKALAGGAWSGLVFFLGASVGSGRVRWDSLAGVAFGVAFLCLLWLSALRRHEG